MKFWRDHSDELIDTLIKPPVQIFVGLDDDLRKRTEARRKAADGIRSRAAHVESGSSVGTVLAMVKR